MKMYRISCESDCGSYFQPYLKSIMVVAENKELAITEVKWILKVNGEEFIYPEKKWDIEDLGELEIGWYSFHHDVDY